MNRLATAVLLAATALLAWTEDPVPAPPHGGKWLDVPDSPARFEIVWSKDKKSATVYSMDKAGAAPSPLKDAPELLLPTLDEKSPILGRALNLKDGLASEFEFRVPPAGDGQPPKEFPPNSGPHGGAWVDIPGHTALIELVHDAKNGRAIIWILAEDGVKPFPVADAPEFNVDTPMDGFVQVTGKAVGLKDGSASRFDFEGADLAQRPPGGGSRFALRIAGKPYQAPIINREHGHMHGPKR